MREIISERVKYQDQLVIINKGFQDSHETMRGFYVTSKNVTEKNHVKKLHKLFMNSNHMKSMLKNNTNISTVLHLFTFLAINTFQPNPSFIGSTQFQDGTTICFRSLSPVKTIDSSRIGFLKKIMIADKSSVRKLRAFYLLLIGENTK